MKQCVLLNLGGLDKNRCSNWVIFFFTNIRFGYTIIVVTQTSNERQKGDFKVSYPNINAERSRAGMTVEDLAKHLGVTRKTVYNWWPTAHPTVKTCNDVGSVLAPLTICWTGARSVWRDFDG